MMTLGPLLEVKTHDRFLHEWDEYELTSLFLKMSRDILEQDACLARHEDCAFVHLIWDLAWTVKIILLLYFPVMEVHNNK